MLARARREIYWPGLDRYVNVHTSKCHLCKGIASFQQKERLISSPIPEFPFQYSVADLFEIEGYKYLVYADRLTINNVICNH